MNKKSLQPDCPICHGANGNHRPMGIPLHQEPLTTKDWKRIYTLTQHWLGGIHEIAAYARWRKQNEIN